MFLIIGAIVIAAAIVIGGQVIAYKDTAGVSEHLFSFVISLVMSLVGVLVWGTITMVVCMFVDSSPELDDDTELQQISMGEQTKGAFFLGSGYIDGDLVYYYYGKNSDGSYYADDISASSAKIVETKDAPHIETYEWKQPEWLMPDWDDWSNDGYSYIIYVPEGSIKPMVDMDLPGAENE